MSIRLNKGNQIDITKSTPNLRYIGIGLGWDINEGDRSNFDFDLDASVFMLAGNRKIPNEQFFVFYNNLKSADGAIEHLGDSRTGEGGGDDETIEIDLKKVSPAIEEILFVVTIHDETIEIDLKKVSPAIEEILFVVTIHDSQTRNQNFGQVENSFIRLYDAATEKEVMRYELNETFSQETAIEFGRLFKHNRNWQFQAIGQGYTEGLQGFVNKYAS